MRRRIGIAMVAISVIGLGGIAPVSATTGDAYYSVADDGSAVGDGITDDTVALQAAFDAAASLKKTIFIPEGSYRFTGPLYVPNTVGIVGAGRASVKLVADDDDATLWFGSGDIGIAQTTGSLDAIAQSGTFTVNGELPRLNPNAGDIDLAIAAGGASGRLEATGVTHGPGTTTFTGVTVPAGYESVVVSPGDTVFAKATSGQNNTPIRDFTVDCDDTGDIGIGLVGGANKDIWSLRVQDCDDTGVLIDQLQNTNMYSMLVDGGATGVKITGGAKNIYFFGLRVESTSVNGIWQTSDVPNVNFPDKVEEPTNLQYNGTHLEQNDGFDMRLEAGEQIHLKSGKVNQGAGLGVIQTESFHFTSGEALKNELFIHNWMSGALTQSGTALGEPFAHLLRGGFVFSVTSDPGWTFINDNDLVTRSEAAYDFTAVIAALEDLSSSFDVDIYANYLMSLLWQSRGESGLAGAYAALQNAASVKKAAVDALIAAFASFGGST